jgi:hypothetical protein
MGSEILLLSTTAGAVATGFAIHLEGTTLGLNRHRAVLSTKLRTRAIRPSNKATFQAFCCDD